MRATLWIVVIIGAVAISCPAQAQICKWVDENGVTHYANECPEQVESVVVDIEPPPPREKVEAYRQRQQEISKTLADQRDRESREAAANQVQQQAQTAQDAAAMQRCVRATTNLATLNLQVPVYYDEQGNLHHDWSARSRAYKGAKRYVEDADRPAEIRRYETQIATDCGQSETEAKNFSRMVAEENFEEFQREICATKKYELERRGGGLTGIMPPAVRKLQAYIEENCE